jgi:hypothetical protein
LRSHLVQLLLEENRIENSGALHLSKLLTAEQMAILEDLPSPCADLTSIIGAHRACAKAFLPRARRLARELSIPWQDRFEEATLRNLREELGFSLSD